MAEPISNIPYTLSIFTGGKVTKTVALPNNPNRVVWAEDFPTTIEYTFGDIPKREHNKPKRWTVDFSGRTGVQPRPKEEGGSNIAPLTIMNDFIDFLEEYQELAAHTGATALARTSGVRALYAATYLILHAFNENIHLMVDVASFSYDRDAARTRHSATWSLSLIGWRRAGMGGAQPGRYLGRPNYAEQLKTSGPVSPAEAAAAAESAKTAMAKANPKGLLATFDLQNATTDTLSKLKAQRDLAVNAQKGTGSTLPLLDRLYQGAEYMNKGISFVRGYTDKVQIAANKYHRVVQEYNNALRSGLDLIHVPQRVLAEVTGSLAELRMAFDSAVYAGKFVWSGAGIPEEMTVMGQLIGIAEEDSACLVGATGGKVSKDVAPATSEWSSKTSPLISAEEDSFGSVYQIPQGAYSWADVSTLIYGDSTYWVTLAKFNGAFDAYSDAQGAPLAPGKLVYLPAVNGDLMDGKKPSADSFYLTDLMLDESGDIALTAGNYLKGSTLVSNVGGDLQTITGYANLIQAITTLTRTPAGSLTDSPDYGLLSVAPGDTLSPHKMAAILVDAQDQLRSDFRIADVQKASAVQNVDALYLQLDLIPSGPAAEPLTVLAPITTS